MFSCDFTLENYEYTPIHKRTYFFIKPKSNSISNSNIHVDIITPSNCRIEGKIEEKSHHLYAIPFIPREIGNHEIIFYNDKEKKLVITKFVCQVHDITKIRISDLPLAVPNRPYQFTSRMFFFIF